MPLFAWLWENDIRDVGQDRVKSFARTDFRLPRRTIGQILKRGRNE